MRSARGDHALEVAVVLSAHIPGIVRRAPPAQEGQQQLTQPVHHAKKPVQAYVLPIRPLEGPVKGRVVQRSMCLDLTSWPPAAGPWAEGACQAHQAGIAPLDTGQSSRLR